MTTHKHALYTLSALALAVSQNLHAEEQAQPEAKKSGLETIVVTGVPRRTTIMASSSSVSSVT